MKIILKNILFVLVVPGTVAGYLPFYIGSRYAHHMGWWRWLGLPSLFIGFGFLLVCVWDFAMKGRGTPLPLDPTKFLVTNRMYESTRNPMYVGVTMAIMGWTLWFSTWQLVLYNLIVITAMVLFVIFVEEPTLRRQFGNAYEDYCKKVPRWF